MTAATIEAYLARVPDDKRAALERLRGQIRAAAPHAVEAISYGMPAFLVDGRYFVGFSAAKGHCSFYVGRAPLDAYAAELAGYRLLKGTINFQPERPLRADLVAKLVKLRIAEFQSP
jgi:uncharacterized protein YdhG (YjbR/CyaY superfamily)